VAGELLALRVDPRELPLLRDLISTLRRVAGVLDATVSVAAAEPSSGVQQSNE
jgi:hypothetical protein